MLYAIRDFDISWNKSFSKTSADLHYKLNYNRSALAVMFSHFYTKHSFYMVLFLSSIVALRK